MKFRLFAIIAPIAVCTACSQTVSGSSGVVGAESSSSRSSSASFAESKSIYAAVSESAAYTTRDSVAAYLCKFGKLPANYRTMVEAESLYVAQGWTFTKWNFNPWATLGVMVGGDSFNNNEELLPENTYHECDVDYYAENRGTNRLVYAKACVIYYTDDHYESFVSLYNGAP
ncbi:MAG: ribonuclease domain-containing protein [Fibrobacteraceae bacterium]